MNIDYKDLKEKFVNIKDNKNNILNTLEYIENKFIILDDIYTSYLSEKSNSITYRTSLDTFHFQSKLIKIEHENYSKIFRIFINRMYGDYYKLYKKIVSFIKSDIKDLNIITNEQYPIYKDLDILFEYPFNIIEDINNDIIHILNELLDFSIKENHNIKDYEIKQSNGINIGIFVNEKKFFIITVEQKICLFTVTLKGHYQFQDKYLKRLYYKLKIIYSQLCHDINTETSVSNNFKLNKNYSGSLNDSSGISTSSNTSNS